MAALRPQATMLAAAAFAGLACAGAQLNARIEHGNDLTVAVADVKERLSHAGELVSLGRVYHRFSYSYDDADPPGALAAGAR